MPPYLTYATLLAWANVLHAAALHCCSESSKIGAGNARTQLNQAYAKLICKDIYKCWNSGKCVGVSVNVYAFVATTANLKYAEKYFIYFVTVYEVFNMCGVM